MRCRVAPRVVLRCAAAPVSCVVCVSSVTLVRCMRRRIRCERNLTLSTPVSHAAHDIYDAIKRDEIPFHSPVSVNRQCCCKVCTKRVLIIFCCEKNRNSSEANETRANIDGRHCRPSSSAVNVSLFVLCVAGLRASTFHFYAQPIPIKLLIRTI